ncbi:hypothetical protein [Chryseobacterium polytrichastri]|uniref:SMI1-KNR4 cell-wall n=1 Tax=Chryseobacterium polytrichastri TaxID=1302687 RepID=A0A1M7AEG7_9FLAO|nr:hypothetical protein [Chryseobacterium polytrichastri]SHL41080.1 hypothetical protein SAMN05444267_101765 [Chryseobacterium polytrichastri]
MEIEYLKKYEFYKQNGASKRISAFGPPVGLTETEIKQLELEMNNGNSFPKVYKEFLNIGGEFSCISLNHVGKNAGKLVIKYKEALRTRNVDIVRPIAILNTFEGQCGVFIFLDNEDNSQPWNFSIHKDYDNDEGEIIWKSPFKTLADMIDELVYISENNLSV